MFDSSAITRLDEKLGYEVRFLDFLYDQTDLVHEGGSTVEIEGDKRHATIAVSPIRLSQSRVNQLINQLYPMVFLASYKTIDMQVEWILEEHEQGGIIGSVPWRFSEKLSTMTDLDQSGDLQLPSGFEGHRRIYDRVFALYKTLQDHRNEVIHGNDFEVHDGDFEVTRDGITFRFTPEQLFAFAKAATISSRLLKTGSATPNDERALRTYLDILDFVHSEGEFGVAAPWTGTIEITVESDNGAPHRWHVDMERVSETYEQTSWERGYYLRVRGQDGGTDRMEWLIPSEVLSGVDKLELSLTSDRWTDYQVRSK